MVESWILGIICFVVLVLISKRLINGYSFCAFLHRHKLIEPNSLSILFNYLAAPWFYGFQIGSNTQKMVITHAETGEQFVWYPVFGYSDKPEE